jgi:hypothetical protein
VRACPLRALELGVALASASAACSVSLDGFTGGAPAPTLPTEGGAPSDTGAVEDSGVPPTESCSALHAGHPELSDGRYTIDPDGDGPEPPFTAYCDMTHDDGGWMLVTEALLESENPFGVSVVKTADALGGLVMQVFANQTGCGSQGPGPSFHTALIRNIVAWTKIRFHEEFAGRASCWTIFGTTDPGVMLGDGLLPFTPGTDIGRDEIGMGGTAGDAFDGNGHRCDNTTRNFWNNAGAGLRAATVILRRGPSGAPAGVSTLVDCDDFGATTNSPTWWRYSDVYVR